MEKRKLGKSDISVAPLALGGNVFGWTADEATSFRLLDAFVDTGLNLIDTADSYSTWVPGHKGGESEIIIGNWLKKSGKRDKVVLATKVASPMGDGKHGLSSKYIRAAVEDSLRRLQTDRIDLYQSHRDDPNTPVAETLRAYAELVEQGKVRAIGCSNFTAARIEESLKASREHGYPEYVCLQPNYNLYDREDYEKDLEPTVTKHGLGVIPYYALASGFLTGKYRTKADTEKAARAGGLGKFFTERGMRILAALEKVAKEHNATQAQVALAWLMTRPSITAPIASATKIDQLHDIYRTKADTEKAARAGGLGKFFTERGMRILAALEKVAKEHNATQAQVALAWLMTRPSITAPIASATKIDQLHDIAAAAKLQLGPSSIEELARASAY